MTKFSFPVCVFLSLLIWGVWFSWMVIMAGSLPPGHDEMVTLLEMRGHANPQWLDFGTVQEHKDVLFNRELTSFSNIEVMLKETDVHPPFYFYMALIVSMITGGDLFFLRLFSMGCVVLGGFGLVTLGYRISDRNPWTMPFVSILVVSAAPLIYAAANARSYGLLFLLFVGIVWSVYNIVYNEKRRLLWSLTLAFCSILAVWTHYFAALGITAVYLSLLLGVVRAKKDILWFAVSSVLVFITSLPLLGWLSIHLHARDGQYEGHEGILREGLAMLRIFAEQVSYTGANGSAWNMVLVLGLGSLVVIVSCVSGLFKRERASFVLFLSLIIGSSLLSGLFYYQDKTLTFLDSSRYGIFLMIFLIPLLARSAKFAFMPMVIIGGLSASSWVYSTVQFDPWSWKNAFSDVSSYLVEDDRMVVFSGGRRGIEGSAIYRAQKGWVSFAFVDPASVEMSDMIKEVRFMSYMTDFDSEQKERWVSWIEDIGFEESENAGTWIRK